MPPSSRYMEVAIPLPVYKTYSYAITEIHSALVSVGKRVLVPFGQRRVTGYILGLSNTSKQEGIKLVLDVLDEQPLFPESMVSFFRWIADYYIHPIGQVIKCALPGGLNINDLLIISITPTGEKILEGNKPTPFEVEILRCLNLGPCNLNSLYRKINKDFPSSLIYTMERRGLISIKRELKGGRTKPKMERYVSACSSYVLPENLSETKQRIVAAVKEKGEISVTKLKAQIPSAPRIIKSLEKAGYITIFEKRVYRDPFGESIKPDTARMLTKEQATVISAIKDSKKKGFTPYLLAGVTGSGKTEIYMQLAEEIIERGHSVLVLVPEIALISQMERRFRARFGDCVAVLHSGLSQGERFDQWRRIVNKEVNIAIGARSAIFAPFDNIGLIIVDEEHDTSYKQEGSLRYNARDLAFVRAKLNNGIALIGSATPSIQSYYNVKIKKFAELTLSKRIESRPLPEISIVDLRKSRDARGIRRFITPELHEAMKETLEREKQVLIFLNRRGFAGYPVCTFCGEAIKCRNCDISLTLHQNTNAYKCHYCGFTLASSTNCLKCGSSKIRLLGFGTEKVEAAVKTLFPEANVVRMDRDTTTRKGSILKILKGLRNGTIDILIGTQMVAQGHDFPNITLVGIICADLSLSFPDFRATERTFQLLAQVSGRAGRGSTPGRVILQTYNPNHFSILSAKDQDFKAFYCEEIRFRKTLNYPPFSRMIQFKISGKDKKKTGQHARDIGDLCLMLKERHKSFSRSVEVLGPIEAFLPRIANQYRWQIILKGLQTNSLHRFTRQLLFENTSILNNRSVMVAVDVDPFFMM